MMIKILNKLYPGKANYKKRNAIYRKVRCITGVIKFLCKCALIVGLCIPTIGGILYSILGA